MRIKEWSPTLRTLNCLTNSPCQHLRKQRENSMKNILTDVRVQMANWNCKEMYTEYLTELACKCLGVNGYWWAVALCSLYRVLNQTVSPSSVTGYSY